MVPFERFETTFKNGLAAAGLQDFIDLKSSQFLDCGSEFFIELVLNDGSKIPDAEGLLGQAAIVLQKGGTILDGVVRAAWEVMNIKPVGHAISSNGYRKASKAFLAELKSGNANCTADDVAAVQRYLEHQLSFGGTSYWNPLKYGRLELNEPAMLYLYSRGLN
jgi:hypothetical protein